MDCIQKGNAMIIALTVGSSHSHSIDIYYMKMSQYFPKPCERSSGNVKVELDLSNFATKADLKEATSIGTSNLAAKSDLRSLKAQVD